MQIDFFNINKYAEIFNKYEYGKIVDLLKHNRNIYVYGDSLYAYIYDNDEYIVFCSETDCTEKISKLEVCYNLARYESDMNIFTEKGFIESIYTNI